MKKLLNYKKTAKDEHMTVDEYIRAFPIETRLILERIRKIIAATAPDAVETIAYKMPAYKLLGKPLVYFAAFKKHIGLYALPSGHSKFADELSKYKHGKGSVQFPLDMPMPYELIEKIISFRVAENFNNAKQTEN